MKRKNKKILKKKLKRLFSLRNLAIFVCVIIILVMLYILLEDKINITHNSEPEEEITMSSKTSNTSRRKNTIKDEDDDEEIKNTTKNTTSDDEETKNTTKNTTSDDEENDNTENKTDDKTVSNKNSDDEKTESKSKNNTKNGQFVTSDGIKVVQTNFKSNEEISEDDAREVAVKQFKEIGESVSKSDLNVMKIQRSGEKYYYVTSTKNSVEIKIEGGEVTRINGVPINI